MSNVEKTMTAVVVLVLGGCGSPGGALVDTTTDSGDDGTTPGPDSATPTLSGTGESTTSDVTTGVPTTGHRDPTSTTDSLTSGSSSSGSSGNTTTQTESTTGGCELPASTGQPEPSECGDDVIEGAEECDDGNLDDFDGCSASCNIEHRPMQLSLSADSSCARFETGGVKCWGGNYWGQLGVGDAEDRGDEPDEMGGALASVPLWFEATSLAVTNITGCALSGSGTVHCWGSGALGQLGFPYRGSLGDEPGEIACEHPTVDLGGFVTSVATRCATLTGGVLKCWGNNDEAELGLGDLEDRGDDPGEMGENLPAVPIGNPVVQVDHGAHAGCALDDVGQVKCWGRNEGCILGMGEPAYEVLVGDEPGELAAAPYLDFGQTEPVAQVSVGVRQACARFTDGRLKCWGANTSHFLPWMDFDTAWGCYGGQMGDNLLYMGLGADEYAVDVGVGYGFGCVLLDTGAVKCWGQNEHGQLGNGSIDDTPLGVSLADLEPVDVGEPVEALAVGSRHVCVIVESGYIKCWGDNGHGQLGYEDTQRRGDDPGEMGSNLPYVATF